MSLICYMNCLFHSLVFMYVSIQCMVVLELLPNGDLRDHLIHLADRCVCGITVHTNNSCGVWQVCFALTGYGDCLCWHWPYREL